MTLINLRGLELELGGYGPLDYAEGTVTYVDSKGAAVTAVGDALRFPGPVTFTITAGQPDVTIDLPATSATVAALWVVRKSDYETSRQEFRRLTAIPATGPVDVGALVEVDRKTLGPLAGGTAAWQVFSAEVAGYRDDAAASKNAAAGSATAASGSATAASGSATAASGSAAAAAGSASAAEGSKVAAGTSETNAKTSETNAAGSAAAANASKIAAGTSETNAKTSETNAKTSETNSKTSETNAAASANTALAGQFLGSQLTINADLNALTAPGVYRAPNVLVNAPTPSFIGIIIVLQRDVGRLVQIAYAQNGGGTAMVSWSRVSFGTIGSPSWSTWRASTSQRIVQPATDPGMEPYFWDDVNGNEFGVMPIKGLNNTLDLNTVKASGVYRQNSGGLLTNNYPIDAFYGVIHVLGRTTSGSGGATQIAYKHNGLSVDSRRYWMRSETASGWGSWNLYSSTKLNVVAGQPGNEMSIYDDSANADRQLELINIPLGTSDLNTITVAGKYVQGNGTNATLARNYPRDNIAGILEVLVLTSAALVQRFTINYGSGPNATTGFFVRRYNGGFWDPWRFISAQRVDNSAGRAIYVMDDSATREQMIYGDTGRRNITSLFGTAVTAGNVLIQRYGRLVTIVLDNVTVPVGAGTVAGIIPAGFRPTSAGVYAVGYSPNTATIWGNGDINLPTGSARYGSFTYPTENAWPTSLPGTADGAIPNL